MKTVLIVQARMTSTRLPGKVLKTVLGKSLLEFQVERLKRCREADAMILATPVAAANEPLWAEARRLQVPVFKGDEEDVLARYYGAAVEAKADVVVRVTSDCPLIDPAVVDLVIRYWKTHQDEADYVSNIFTRTYPRGMDTEVFPFRILNVAHHEAKAPLEREHVTPFIWRHPERFRIANVSYRENQSRHRWTVDTPEDFELIKRVIEALYPQQPAFTLKDVLDLLDRHPDWTALNAGIEQKPLASS